MIPTIDQTYEAVVRGVSLASEDPTFGERLLKSRGSREKWLYQKMAAELRRREFDAKPDYDFIDIAVFNPELAQVIEVKFYYCHQFSRTRHKYLGNTWTDFLARSIYGLPQQAILFVGQYMDIPPMHEMGNLYRANGARKAIKEGGFDFNRIEAELIREFGNSCFIRPSQGQPAGTSAIWTAKFGGAEMLLRAWVLELKPSISTSDLTDRLRACTTDREFEKRMHKCRKAWDCVTRLAAKRV